MKKSSLYLKSKEQHGGKLKIAKAHKRLFKGVCGGLSYREMARRLRAGKPEGDKE